MSIKINSEFYLKFKKEIINKLIIFLKSKLKEKKIIFILREYNAIIPLLIASFKEIFNKNEEKVFDILLHVTDAGYGLNFDNKKYSQLIDSLAFDLDLLGYRSAIFRHWRSKIKESDLYRKTYPINLKFLKYFIRNCFKFNKISSVLVNTWQDVLETFEYKAIIGIQPDAHLSEAALNLKKPLVDLQHGLVLKDASYGPGDIVCYYDYLWKTQKFKNKPDNFLGIFKYNTEDISFKKKSKTSIFYVGSPYLANTGLIEKKEFINTIDDQFVRVLFAQQAFFGKKWGFINDDIEGQWTKEGIPYGLIKAIKNSPKNIYWNIRLHPLNSPDAVKKIKNTFDSIKVGSNSKLSIQYKEIPLINQLINTDLLINWCSSCTNEAAEMGIKSIILDQRECSKAGYQKEYNNGLVYFKKNNMEEIISLVNECKQNKKDIKTNIYDYRKLYLKRLKVYLRGLIDEKY